MAYKFQLGSAVLSGSVSQEGSIKVLDDSGNEKGSFTSAGALSASAASKVLSLDINSSTAAISSAGAYTGASVDVSGKVDGATGFDVNGTNIVDSSRNVGNVGTLSGSGAANLLSLNVNSSTAAISSAGAYTGASVDVSGKVDGATGFDVDGTNVISSSRAIANVTTISGSGKIEGSLVDVDGKVDGKAGFDVNGTNVISSARAVGNVTTISGSGAANLLSVDINSSTAAISSAGAYTGASVDVSGKVDGATGFDVNGTNVIDSSRNIANAGTVSGSGKFSVKSLAIDSVDVTATAAELNYVDIASLGTGAASKALVFDASKQFDGASSGMILSASVVSGTAVHVPYSGLKINGTAVSSTADELNILDGVTATAAELNYVDIASLGTGAASKALVFDASKQFDGVTGGLILSASIMSASNFYGDGSGLKGISSDNVDVTAKTDNVEYNLVAVAAAGDGVALVDVEAAGKTFTINASTGKISLAGDAALGTNDSDVVTIPAVLSASSGRFELSGNLGSTNYIKDWGGGAMATTESLGGKQVFGGYGNPYIHTKKISIDTGGGEISHNSLEQKSSGQLHLSSSLASGDFDFPGLKFSSRAAGAASLVEFEAKNVSFNLSTASVTGEKLEYFWAVESAHYEEGSGDDRAWLNLDLSSSTKNFTVGGRDSVQLIANAGLQVNTSRATMGAGLTVNGASTVLNGTLSVNNTSSFGGPATFNDHAIVANRGATINGLAAHSLTVNPTASFNNRVNLNSAVVANSTVSLNNTASIGGPATFNNHAAAFNAGLTSTTISASSTLQVGGNVTMQGLGSATVTLADDLMIIDDGASGVIKTTSLAAYAAALAGGSNEGLASTGGRLELDLNDLSAAVIDVSADSLAFIDADGSNGTKKESIADLAGAFVAGTTNGLSASNGVLGLSFQHLGAGAVAVSADSMAFKDADDNHTKLTTIASFVSSIAGGGLTATNGVLSTQAGSVAVVADGGTLSEGYNYLADISSNATVTLPSGSQGDVVHVKAADLNSGAVVIINCSGSQTIDDDHTSIRIESGFGAASLVYVAANKWRLV